MKKKAMLFLAVASFAALAQESSHVKEGRNGTAVVVSGNEGARNFHSRWGYAPAVRAGDLIVMAGLIAGPAPGDGKDADAFKRGLTQTFMALQQELKPLGVTLDDAIKLNTYHVFDSPWFEGDKMAHMEAVREVKTTFMGGANATWTAIGVSELFSDSGLVEIEVTLYAPQE